VYDKQVRYDERRSDTEQLGQVRRRLKKLILFHGIAIGQRGEEQRARLSVLNQAVTLDFGAGFGIPLIQHALLCFSGNPCFHA
jgi:hypothetical protein